MENERTKRETENEGRIKHLDSKYFMYLIKKGVFKKENEIFQVTKYSAF